jgi:hypothetical protein
LIRSSWAALFCSPRLCLSAAQIRSTSFYFVIEVEPRRRKEAFRSIRTGHVSGKERNVNRRRTQLLDQLIHQRSQLCHISRPVVRAQRFHGFGRYLPQLFPGLLTALLQSSRGFCRS